MMKNLKGTKTHDNLKAAFAGESQANRRYLYFANKADVEGQNDVAALFRSTAEGETGHAHGHLEYLEEVGDPATGEPIGATDANLKASIAGETHEYTDMYPGMAKSARSEGFDEIADWFETLAKAERSHANRFQKALDALALELGIDFAEHGSAAALQKKTEIRGLAISGDSAERIAAAVRAARE
jgi:rubrerythrin